MAPLKLRIPKPTTVDVNYDGPLSKLLSLLCTDHGFQTGCIKILVGGKVVPLEDETQTLSSLGITEATPLLVLKVASSQAVQEHQEEDARMKEVSKISDLTEKLAARSDAGRYADTDQHYFAITNQVCTKRKKEGRGSLSPMID